MTFYLSLDAETSGLPPAGVEKGSPSYPWPVQVGAVLFDDNDEERAIFKSKVRADGRKMQAGAIAVHGITDRDAGREGLSEITVLGVICGFAAQASFLVGFNIEFDRDILASALMRLGKSTQMLTRAGLQFIDLQKPSASLCKIPTEHESGSYKWPSLDVACQEILLEEPRSTKHDALDDAQRARRLFWALKQRNVIEVAA